MKCFITVCSLILISFAAFSQSVEQQKEKIQQIEQDKANERQRAITQQLDSAVMLMDREEYIAADEKFMFVLKNTKSIPSDLAFYFGKNSFHLKKYKQSVDWLNKYIQLKGTSGKFSESAVTYLRQSEEKLLEQRQSEAQQTQQILSRDYDVDCGPSGKIVCPVCNGSAVVVKKSYLGETYKSCPYCHKLGYLTCEEYNKLLRGQLKPNP